MSKKKKKWYKNPKGNLTVEEFIEMMHKKTLRNYVGKMWSTNKGSHEPEYGKCPPKELLRRKSSQSWCCYCVDCYKDCKKEVKEYKNYYKIGRKKYNKEDIK